jgi:hypothetical protein
MNKLFYVVLSVFILTSTAFAGGMVYILTPVNSTSGQCDAANAKVVSAGCDTSNATFVPNEQDSIGNHYCVVSIPDDNSIYDTCMKNNFLYGSVDLRGTVLNDIQTNGV